jgi:methylmalonyl-CoA mutase cobalamin-binding subunit
MTTDPLARAIILPEPDLPPGSALLDEGRALAGDWHVGASAFLAHVGENSEAAYKRRNAGDGRIMRHGQIGFRDFGKSLRCYSEIWEACDKAGARVDRYGITLDWAMGYPLAMRSQGPRGTGMWLESPEQCAELTAGAPVAPHFGDWVLGFPAAVTNTCWALAAGCTSIGNLGQLFTFRLPDWDDDVTSVAETVKALGLIAAQPVEVLVHSNLDDGFAATFQDLASCLGAALIERHIVEDLIGGSMAHCYGHHYSEPVARMAFHFALADGATAPGSMVYGNTTAYRGDEAQNYASLAGYLLTDILGQTAMPTGHAINPVPVTENERIPDIDEVVAAQLFADRLIEQAEGLAPLCDVDAARAEAARIVAGGQAFRDRVMAGLADRGYDTTCPFELFLALRRIGARRLEKTFGHAEPVATSPVKREIDLMAARRLDPIAQDVRDAIAGAGLRAMVATSDVHEHGKTLLETMCADLEVEALDGGLSVDPDDLVAAAIESGCDLLCISTYNGVALSYVRAVLEDLAAQGSSIPVLIGGRLNQIPDASNTSLPVDVADRIAELGVTVCRDAADLVPVLAKLAKNSQPA